MSTIRATIEIKGTAGETLKLLALQLDGDIHQALQLCLEKGETGLANLVDLDQIKVLPIQCECWLCMRARGETLDYPAPDLMWLPDDLAAAYPGLEKDPPSTPPPPPSDTEGPPPLPHPPPEAAPLPGV